MRIYRNFKDAINEIRRDLGEMGITVLPKTYQNKDISGDPDHYATKELQNYIYTVTSPDSKDLDPVQPWAQAELGERLDGGVKGLWLNPGLAHEHRPSVWLQFLNEDGQFCYTYSERFARNMKIQRIIDHIRKDPDSRQLYLNMWADEDIANIGGIKRVPCTLGYHFMVRGGQLNVTYLMRSCDFATHFQNDLWLCHEVQKYIAEQTGYAVGNFTHWMASLHIYAKDIQDVF